MNTISAQKVGNSLEADATFGRAVEIGGKVAAERVQDARIEVELELAQALLQQGKVEEARAQLQDVLEQGHSTFNASVHNLMAFADYLEGKLDGALREVETAIEGDADSEYLPTRALVLVAMGRMAQACGDADRAIANSAGDDPTALAVRGRCRETQGNRDGAIKDYRAALKFDADVSAPAHNLARARLRELGFAQ